MKASPDRPVTSLACQPQRRSHDALAKTTLWGGAISVMMRACVRVALCVCQVCVCVRCVCVCQVCVCVCVCVWWRGRLCGVCAECAGADGSGILGEKRHARARRRDRRDKRAHRPVGCGLVSVIDPEGSAAHRGCSLSSRLLRMHGATRCQRCPSPHPTPQNTKRTHLSARLLHGGWQGLGAVVHGHRLPLLAARDGRRRRALRVHAGWRWARFSECTNQQMHDTGTHACRGQKRYTHTAHLRARAVGRRGLRVVTRPTPQVLQHGLGRPHDGKGGHAAATRQGSSPPKRRRRGLHNGVGCPLLCC
jgi:hypothetical protein